jgi:hypothetical protein
MAIKQNQLDPSISLGGGGGADSYDAFLNQRKTGQTFKRAPNDYTIVESFTETSGLSLSLAKAYSTSDGTEIYLHENMNLIDAMDATSGWTAGTNTPTIALNGSTFQQGTGSVSMAKTSLNGILNMNKTIAFSLYKQAFRCWVRFDTLTNVSTTEAINVYLESSSGNFKKYSFPVSRFVANAWALIECDAEGGTSTGTPNMSTITKVTLETVTTASQTLTVLFDYLVRVTNQDIITSRYSGLSMPIWDATNQEFMVLSSEDATVKGKYTLTSALTNNYAIATAISRSNGMTITNNSGSFETATGAHSKTQWKVDRQLFVEEKVGKTLQTKVSVMTDSLEVLDLPTGTSLRLAGDYTGRFKSGDKIVMWYMTSESFDYMNSSYAEFVAAWNGAYKVLTLSANSTFSSPNTTLSFTGNHDITSVKNLFISRIPVIAKGFIGSGTANEALADLTLKSVIPSNRTSLFVDDFNRADNSTVIGGPWSKSVNEYTGSTPYYGILSNAYRQSGYNGTDIGISNYPTSNQLLQTKNFEANFDLHLNAEIVFYDSHIRFHWGENDLDFHNTRKLYVQVGRSGSNFSDLYINIWDGTNVASTTLVGLQNKWVRVKIVVRDKLVLAKVWERGTIEKSTWDVTYSNAVWDLAKYWGLYTRISSGGSANSSFLTLDNFSLVAPEGSGFDYYYEDPEKTGTKMVVAAAIDRQDTTNESPLITGVISTLV